jgi:hypothetical protein
LAELVAGKSAKRESAWIVVGLAAICTSHLVVEIALTKFLSYKVYHHYAYAVIATVVLALGAAGAYVHVRYARGGDRARPADFTPAARAATHYAISLCLSTILFCWIPLDPYDFRLSEFARAASLPVYLALFCVPLFFAGVCISYTLAFSVRTVSTIYFWDLLAAALGALASVVLLQALGGHGTMAAAAALGMIAAAAYGRLADPGVRTPGWRHYALAAAALAALLAYPRWAVNKYTYEIRSTKDILFKTVVVRDFGGVAQTYWNAIARIDVSKTNDSRERVYRYGLPEWSYARSIPGRFILVDGGANTRQFRVSGSILEQSYLGDALWAAPYRAGAARGKTLVIGGGGGIDILVAKHFGVGEVQVAELNPATAKILTGTAPDPERADYLPWLVSDQNTRVAVHESEGRHFCTTQASDSYDVVLASGVDTLTAVATGGLDLVENYLYTSDAVKEYVRILKPEGVLSLTHWRLKPPSLALRMFLTYLEYLEQQGVREPWRHVIVIADKAWTGSMLKKTPFQASEIEQLRGWATRAGYAILFDPSQLEGLDPMHPTERVYWKLARSPPRLRAQLVAAHTARVAPVGDDKPYFYRVGNKGEDWLLKFGAASLGIAVLLFVALRRALAAHAFRPVAVYASFFALSGFAFLMFEAAIIQTLTVVVGGPTYSLVIVLVGVLVGYAIGAGLAGRLQPSPAVFLTLGVILGGALLLLGACVGAFKTAVLPWSFAGRVTACAVLTLGTSVLVGFPVPLAMAALRAAHGGVVASMWGVNTAFNVLGAIAFVPLAQSVGFAKVLMVVAGTYFAALAWLALAAKARLVSPAPSAE